MVEGGAEQDREVVRVHVVVIVDAAPQGRRPRHPVKRAAVQDEAVEDEFHQRIDQGHEGQGPQQLPPALHQMNRKPARHQHDQDIDGHGIVTGISRKELALGHGPLGID